MTQIRLLMGLLAFALLAGCGSGQFPAKVRGEVTIDGQPLAKGTIILAVAGHPEATGSIENGKIVSVGTFNTDDGAAVGSASIAIQSIEISAAPVVVANPGDNVDTIASMSGRSLLPARYGNPATSGITEDLKPGPNELKIALQSQ